ncbi:MAG: hypothetical protein ACKOZW_15380 [Cyanobium sp.]
MRPSFRIEAASSGAQPPPLRLDRINSRDLLAAARSVYFAFLAAAATAEDPLGVVVSCPGSGAMRGRVVFALPVLLPEEEFVALDLLRSRSARAGGLRNASGRARPLRPLPP